MRKIYFSNILSLVIVLLMFVACEKEAIQTIPTQAIVLTESEQALKFLDELTTPLPLASLKIDHTTHKVNGYFIDSDANLRKISIEDAPYLGMDEITLDGYFMEQLQLASELVSELEPIEVVTHLRAAMNLELQTKFTVKEEVTNSEILVFLRQNLQGNNHNRDCVGGNRHSIGGTYNKILIAGSGQINYAANTAEEKSLVEWMKSLEELASN